MSLNDIVDIQVDGYSAPSDADDSDGGGSTPIGTGNVQVNTSGGNVQIDTTTGVIQINTGP